MTRREMIKMTDSEIEEFLTEPRTMNLASHNPDGSIHLIAMWFGLLPAGVIGFETFAKSQKVKNLQRDQRVSALVEAGESYDQLRGVQISGEMDIVDDPGVLNDIALSVLARYHPEVVENDRQVVAEMVVKKRVALILRPNKIVSWDHRKLAGGY